MAFSLVSNFAVTCVRAFGKFGGARRTQQSKHLVRVIAGVLVASTLVPVFAQDSASPAPSPQLTAEQEARKKQLEAENAILKLEKEQEGLKKDIRDAQFNPTVAAPEGKVTVTNAFIETEVMSYKAMSEVADEISREISGNCQDASAIAIYNSKDVKDWRFYQAVHPVFQEQLTKLNGEYRSLLGKEEKDRLSEIETLKDRVKALAIGGASAAFAPALFSPISNGVFDISSTARSLLDLMSLFRTETNITGVSVTVDESAMVAELLRFLRTKYDGKPTRFYYPAVMPPQSNSTSPEATINMVRTATDLRIDAEKMVVGFDVLSSLLKEKTDEMTALNDAIKKLGEQIKTNEEALATNAKLIQQLRAKLANTRRPSVRAALEKQIADAEKKKQETTAQNEKLSVEKTQKEQKAALLKDAIRDAQSTVNAKRETVAQLKSLNQQLDKLLGDFAKMDVATGVNALSVFVKAESLEAALGDHGYWLEVKAVKAGGNNRTRRNLIRYFSGARVDHSGGFIIEYAIYDKTGAVVHSDKLAKYDGYMEPKQIVKLKDQ